MSLILDKKNTSFDLRMVYFFVSQSKDFVVLVLLFLSRFLILAKFTLSTKKVYTLTGCIWRPFINERAPESVVHIVLIQWQGVYNLTI